MNVLIAPPCLEEGSVGDSAITRSVARQLIAQGHSVGLHRVTPTTRVETGILNPDGSPVRSRPGEWAQHLVILGADVIDGRYIFRRRPGGRLFNLKQDARGMDGVYVVGTSSRNTTFFDCPNLQFVSARDEDTMTALASIPNVVRCADPAFLLPKVEPVCGDLINFVSSHDFIAGNFPHGVVAQQFIDLARERGLGIFPIVHDTRKSRGDVVMREWTIHACREVGVPVYDGEAPLVPEVVKWVAGEACLSVACKMHFGVLALSAGGSVMAFPYDSKFNELERLFPDNIHLSQDEAIPVDVVAKLLAQHPGSPVDDLAARAVPTIPDIVV